MARGVGQVAGVGLRVAVPHEADARGVGVGGEITGGDHVHPVAGGGQLPGDAESRQEVAERPEGGHHEMAAGRRNAVGAGHFRFARYG